VNSFLSNEHGFSLILTTIILYSLIGVFVIGIMPLSQIIHTDIRARHGVDVTVLSVAHQEADTINWLVSLNQLLAGAHAAYAFGLLLIAAGGSGAKIIEAAIKLGRKIAQAQDKWVKTFKGWVLFGLKEAFKWKVFPNPWKLKEFSLPTLEVTRKFSLLPGLPGIMKFKHGGYDKLSFTYYGCAGKNIIGPKIDYEKDRPDYNWIDTPDFINPYKLNLQDLKEKNLENLSLTAAWKANRYVRCYEETGRPVGSKSLLKRDWISTLEEE